MQQTNHQLHHQQQNQELAVATVTSTANANNELEFILPQTLSADTAYAQISGTSAIELQQLANAGVVQLRQFQTVNYFQTNGLQEPSYYCITLAFVL